MQQQHWYIYKITSPTGSVYIGKTARLKDRLYNYSRLNCKDQRMLYNSFYKYGFDNHNIEIIDQFHSSSSYANGKEIMWIRSYMSNITKWRECNGMNLTNGGEGSSWEASAEMSMKLSKLRKGRKHSEQAKINISNSLKGKPSSNKGKKMSEAQKLHLSNIKKGIAPAHRVGVPLSEDAKKRISEAKKGKPSLLKGSKKTEEMKIRISKTHFTKPILQYNINGEFIAEFKSAVIASKELGINECCIRDILRGKVKNPKLFIFKHK